MRKQNGQARRAQKAKSKRGKKAASRSHEKKAKSPKEAAGWTVVDVFLDESGNTGTDVFHTQQPYLYMLATICPVSARSAVEAEVRRWTHLVELPELKGSELAERGIAKFARDLASAVRKYRLEFIFCCVEKKFAVAVQLFDAIFDPGLNPAVGSEIWFKGMRLPLLHIFLEYVRDERLVSFWQVLGTLDLDHFGRLCGDLLADRPQPTHRREHVIHDSLRWAQFNGAELLTRRRDRLNAPNLAAFSLVLSALNERPGTRVREVTHDEQKQFQSFLKEMYDRLNGLYLPSDEFWGPSMLLPCERLDADVHFASSTDNPMLQLTDVCLWFCKRQEEDKIVGDFDGYSSLRASLHQAVKEVGLSFGRLQRGVAAMHAEAMAAPMPEHKLEEAKQLIADLERKRKARISGQDS